MTSPVEQASPAADRPGFDPRERRFAVGATALTVALALGISLEDAQRLVDGANCPKVFRADGTVYLI